MVFFHFFFFLTYNFSVQTFFRFFLFQKQFFNAKINRKSRFLRVNFQFFPPFNSLTLRFARKCWSPLFYVSFCTVPFTSGRDLRGLHLPDTLVVFNQNAWFQSIFLILLSFFLSEFRPAVGLRDIKETHLEWMKQAFASVTTSVVMGTGVVI